VAESDRVADTDGAVADDGGLEATAVLQGSEYSCHLGNFLQMAARLKEPETPHEHSAHGKFAIEEIDQRHTSRDYIASAFVGECLGAELGGSGL
jgi:hypothetical protein